MGTLLHFAWERDERVDVLVNNAFSKCEMFLRICGADPLLNCTVSPALFADVATT